MTLSSSAPLEAPPSGKRVSLRDRAYAEIKRRIVTTELKPGEAVTVTDLADALGFGRTPVIQAVDRLMIDGLVEVMPRKGVVVSPVSLDELVEIIEIRLLNEGQAARWAAERASAALIEEMRANLEGLKAATQARDLEKLIELDRAFHRLITQGAGNSILAEILGNLHDRSSRFWAMSLNVPRHDARVIEQHTAIIEAIAAHDPDRAEQAVRDHAAAFQQNLVSQVLKVRS